MRVTSPRGVRRPSPREHEAAGGRATALALLLLALTGCSTARYLLPNTVAPELEHMSHVTQHEPFGSDQYHYHANIAQLTAHWDLPRKFYLDISEGVDLNPAWPKDVGQGYGEIAGPKEEFTARVGWKFTVRQ